MCIFLSRGMGRMGGARRWIRKVFRWIILAGQPESLPRVSSMLVDWLFAHVVSDGLGDVNLLYGF